MFYYWLSDISITLYYEAYCVWDTDKKTSSFDMKLWAMKFEVQKVVKVSV
jgi:hypothetical protein